MSDPNTPANDETGILEQKLPNTDAFQEPLRGIEDAKVEAGKEPVHWDTDPANPLNWSTAIKIYQVSVPSLLGFICTMGSSVYVSGMDDIMQEFGVSHEASALGLSLYVLGLAFGPVIAAPLSEHLGRRYVYYITFLISALFTLGAGFSQTFSALLACRFFAGFFSGPVLAIGSGTIADMFPPVYRCVNLAVFVATAFIGPLLGPVQADWAVERKGWRWTQWLILFWTALGAIWLIPFRETHKATLLKARERKLKAIGHKTGQEKQRQLHGRQALIKGLNEARNSIVVLVFRPIRMLFTEPILAAFSLYIGFNFGVFYGFFGGAFPMAFSQTGVYHFSLGISGLAWLGQFIGSILALLLIWQCDERIYQVRHFRAAAQGNTKGIAPENRLYPAMIGCAGIPLALFWFGWTARPDVHWICPIIASVFFTFGSLAVFVSGLIYLGDVFGALLGASALAANGLVRYGFATAFPLFSTQMYGALGIGWASSLLGFVSVLLCPIPFILFKYGPQIRARSGRNEVS